MHHLASPPKCIIFSKVLDNVGSKSVAAEGLMKHLTLFLMDPNNLQNVYPQDILLLALNILIISVSDVSNARVSWMQGPFYKINLSCQHCGMTTEVLEQKIAVDKRSPLRLMRCNSRNNVWPITGKVFDWLRRSISTDWTSKTAGRELWPRVDGPKPG